MATHGIPPFPDHCYLEIPENVIKFDENHSTIFVRISETFLFKSILIVYNEKIGPCSRKKKPNLVRGARCYKKIIEGVVSNWLIFRNQLVNSLIHSSIFLYLRITRKWEFKLLTQVLIIKQKLQETFHELSPGSRIESNVSFT